MESKILGTKESFAFEQLRLAQRLLALQLLGGESVHTLNNTLMGIQVNAELAAMDVEPEHPVMESITVIEEATGRSSIEVERLLSFSSRSQFRQAPLELCGLLRAWSQTLSIFLPDSIDWRLSLPEMPLDIFANAVQLTQMLWALFLNAWEALPAEGGLIACSMTEVEFSKESLLSKFPKAALPAGKFALLSFRNQGSALDGSLRETIWEPFFSTKESHAGLGLSLVSGVLRRHSGQAWLVSSDEEETEFGCMLPLFVGR